MANRRGKSRGSDRFFFLGSKITVDDDYSQEIRRCLPLGRKAMTNLNSVLKSRATTLPTKVHMRVGPYRRLSAKEFMLLNYGAGEDS